MYKKLFAMLGVSTALLCGTESKAQWHVGIEAGANKNYLSTNTADKPFFEYQPSNGYSAGISVRYEIPNLPWFGGIQVVPTYVQKNYRMQRTGYYSPMYEQNTNTYLQLPVIAQFRFGGHIAKEQTLHGILNLGGYGAYWLSGHIKGRMLSSMDLQNYMSYDEAYTFNKTKDRRIEFGAVAGVGLQYAPNKKYSFSLEGRYTPSLTDHQKAYSENQNPRYNDTYSILLGVQYQLKHNKRKA